MSVATTELMFVLDVDDGWPPVAKECMVSTATETGYRIEVPPLFIKNLAVGDVITVELNEEGDVTNWSHVEESKRSTVWIMVHGDYSITDAIDCLKKLKCNVEEFEQYRYFSIDVPEECSLEQLDACLSALDDEKASIAYPSFRH
jgi:hypothetical protein